MILSALPYGLCALAGAIVAAWVVTRLGKSRRRTLQKTLAERELALLDARAEGQRAKELATLDTKRESVLAMAMGRLKAAEERNAQLESGLLAERKRHKTEVAMLTVAATESRLVARKAAETARKAAAHLNRLESVTPATQTIQAHEPKSYGSGEAHTVSVVDQATVEARRDAIARMSHRDSALLSRLRSSNETRSQQRIGLKSIKGISPALERRLKSVGIHRVEQLANLSDSEADALDRQLAGTAGSGRSAALQDDARKLLEQRPPG